jgi:hypothetical protein
MAAFAALHHYAAVGVACLGLLGLIAPAQGARSAAERTAFKREQPCPATGHRRGPCPGYVIDHVQPLCAGGPDRRDNMQWQTHADAIRKDIGERRECRAFKRRP